jgi:hypothetical protein
MPRTQDADKAGTTDYLLEVASAVALEDPDKEGNLGRQGADEFFEVQVFATEAEAKLRAPVIAANLAAKPKTEVQHARITKRRWVREEYDDAHYGHIVDAFSDDVGDLYGYPSDDGTITWDEEWSR